MHCWQIFSTSPNTIFEAILESQLVNTSRNKNGISYHLMENEINILLFYLANNCMTIKN